MECGVKPPHSTTTRFLGDRLRATVIIACCLTPWLACGEVNPILDPAFQEQLNASTHSVLSVSDDIQLLVNGKESYPVRWRMLENARKSIHFTTLYIFADETTERLRDLLIRKKSEGVDVKIIVYGPYTFGNIPFYRAMRKHGIEVQLYSSVPDVLLHGPMRFWRKHLHDKYLVVDGAEAITGGMNWSGRYARGGTKSDTAWRDTDIYVHGPQAEIIEDEFMMRWYREAMPELSRKIALGLEDAFSRRTYPASLVYEDYLTPLGAKQLTRFLLQEPFEDSGAANITNFYQAMIDKAQSHVWWQSISTRPAPIQKEALLKAAARGVEVRLMTNSKRNMRMIPIGGLPVYLLTHAYYKELLAAGVRIFEYYGDAPMHGKAFIVDDVVTVIGSYNATFTAEKYYTESAIATYDTKIIRDVRKMFEDDMACCIEVTLDAHGRVLDTDATKLDAR